MPNDEGEQKTEVPDPIQLLGQAAEAVAKKDDLTSLALQAFRRTRWIVIIWIAALSVTMGFVTGWVHDINSRSAHNTPLFFCVAASEQAVAKDIHTLITSRAKAPAESYKIPASCKLVQ
jgi:hypothetical protein